MESGRCARVTTAIGTEDARLEEATPDTETPSAARLAWERAGLALVLLGSGGLVGLVALGKPAPVGVATPFGLWLCATAFLLAAFGLVGHLMNRRYLGFLITESNVMSASRTQWALWFLAIASTYLVLAVLQMARAAPPTVRLEQGLLLATMASSGSLVGAQALGARKRSGRPDPAKVAGLAMKEPGLRPRGLLWAYDDPKRARFTDVFDGDELDDGASVDATKVQMLLLTAVLVLVFLLQFFRSLDAATLPEALPDVPETLTALLGISQAGYLGSKVQRRTPELDA